MRKLGFIKKLGFIIGIIVLLMAVMPVSDGLPAQAAEPNPEDPDWYWKPGNFTDYALSGMPDFDQRQDNWFDPTGIMETYCGPVAVANSMWYFDSREETGTTPPPAMSDSYPLVTNFSAPWDDHNVTNVEPLVNNLSELMNTDGKTWGPPHNGTDVMDMQKGIDQFLVNAGLYGYYYEKTVKSPNFSWIKEEVLRCEDVILLLGFWQSYYPDAPPEDWWRVGGHYVTCAGVNKNASKPWIAISDPFFDNFEAGCGPGRMPVWHQQHPNNHTVHNDTQYVCHDMYNVIWDQCPGGNWSLENYTYGKQVEPFIGQNWAPDLTQYQGNYIPDPAYPVHTQIDYAVAVSPKEPDLNKMIESTYDWAEEEGNVSVTVHVTDLEWNATHEIWDMEIFFWDYELGTQSWAWKNFTAPFPLVHCVNYTFNVTWKFSFLPEIVVIHFSDGEGENIGFAFSEPPYEDLPDLIVLEKWETVEGCMYWVNYMVQNVGNAPAGNSTTCIYADGKEVANTTCPALLAGEGYTDSVGPFDCPGNTTVTIVVEADNYDDVFESNEENNWNVNEMPQPLEFGDAPDPTYPSLLASDGSRHCPTNTELLGLGLSGQDCKDFELDARVIDNDKPFSDGLVTTFIAANDTAAKVQFEVTNNITLDNLIVNILIDLNIDNDWTDPGEHVVQNQPIPLPGPNDGTFWSNSFNTTGATPGQTWLRLTLTRTPVTVPWNGTGLFACGETEDWNITIEEEEPEGWYYKPNQTDYAPSGMPDFDQKQDLWQNPPGGPWTYCGPVAVANSLWWFDSQGETGGIPPPAINDSYSLVTSYNASGWDDHDPLNVEPLVEDLAWYMDTDGQRTMMPHNGTDVMDMQQGIRDYLNATGYNDSYYEHTEQWPNYSWIEDEVGRCQDVILLLGFYQSYPNGDPYYERFGGHYVTCAGVNFTGDQLGISDPYFDNAELLGQPGRVLPAVHPAHPANHSVHNNTTYVSHDTYNVIQIFPGNMAPCWALQNYPVGTNPTGKNITNFIGQNGGPNLPSGAYNPDGPPVEVIIDYAVAVSPVAGVNATLVGQVNFSLTRGDPPSNRWIETFVVRFFDNATQNETTWSPINATTNTTGFFNITGLSPDTYDIGIKNYTSLSQVVTNVTLTAGNTTVVNFSCLHDGDASGDDLIDSDDFSLLSFAYNTWPSKPKWDPNCDFDRDNVVDSTDFSLLSFYYNTWGPLYGV